MIVWAVLKWLSGRSFTDVPGPLSTFMNRRQLCALLIALATFVLIPKSSAATRTNYIPVTLPADFLGTNFALMHGTVSLEGKKGFVAYQVRRASARRFLGHTPWRRFGPGL